MAELPADSIFAGYRIERVLGAGGMGTVYLARHPDLPRSEAIKVLSPELSRDPSFRARFLREADVAASLDHPNIVSIHQRGEYDGRLWIAMQYVEGTDADAALTSGAMNPSRAMRIISEVGKALDYAHQRGVVHRDVKPANFLLSGGGEDERVLLADFGIARALGDVGLTATGSVLATLAYAAPEVLAGQQFDGRSDLYSLGCSLFRLLTGRNPYFQADGAMAVMAAHLHQPPPLVSESAPWLPPQIDWVIAKAMAKEPAHRFTTAREFAEAAELALGGGGAPAGAQSAPPRTAPTAPWHPSSPPPQPVYQSQPPFDPVAHGGFGPAQQPWLNPAPPPPPKRRRATVIAAIVTATAVVSGGITAWAVTGSDSGQGASEAAEASTSPTTAAKLVPNSALSGFFPSPAEVAEIIGVPELVLERTLPAIQDDSSSAVDRKECLSAVMPLQVSVYQDSEWKAAVVQFLMPPNGQGSFVIQGVVSYPTPELAEAFARDQRQAWIPCAGTTVVTTVNAVTFPQTLGSVEMPDDLSITLILTRPDNFTCQRALTVRNNVVVDLNACRPGITDQGAQLLKQIAVKIPA